MKKRILIISAAVLTNCFILSCSKTEMAEEWIAPQPTEEFSARAFFVNDKSYGVTYSYEVKLGHSVSDCGNSCETTWGTSHHVDCQGYGNACTISSRINMAFNKDNLPGPYTEFDATDLGEYELTDQDNFLFPSRSILVVDSSSDDKKLWINIPAQTLRRDAKSNLFIFRGLFYSHSPAFNND